MALNVALLRESFETVVSREPEITARFYKILFARYPQAEYLFGRNSAKKQQEMLRDALVAVMDHLEDAPWLKSTLMALGSKHVGYGIKPHMYPWVGECLVAALSEVAGKDWTAEVNSAWLEAYAAISGLMLAGAEAPVG